jgi:hypothetical protein
MTPAERLAAHEAGHCCAALVLGVPVRTISIEPDATTDGRVLVEYRPGDLRKRGIIALAGMIESAETEADLPTWPLRTDRTTDERNLAEIARVLEFTETDYRELLIDALDITLSPDYRMLHVATCGLLDYRPTMDGDLLRHCLNRIIERRR